MADLKISQLNPATTPLAGTEVLPIVQSSSTKKVSVADLTAGRAVAMAGGSFTDNITQSTAAKGINFTANTPAAGMTSQLLNWYEEGTWTPVVTAGSGTITTVGAVSGTYTRIGRQVILNFSVTITTNGTGTGSVLIAGIPFTINGRATGSGRENASTGDMFNVTGSNGTTSIGLVNYNNAYPGGSGYRLEGFAQYIV